jgi:acetolactate synthase-1/2/3 large subunit
MVSLPLDIQTSSADVSLQPSFRPALPAPATAEIEKTLDHLRSAQRPVVVLGGGMRGAGYDQNLIKLVERLQIPVVTTWLRKNLFPNDSSLFCGSLGYGAVEVTDDLVRHADVIVSLGCRFSEFTSKRWSLLSPETTLIQVDIDPDSLGRYYVPAVGICADAPSTVAALLAGLDALDDAAPQRAEAARQRRHRHATAARATYLAQTGMPTAAPGATGVPSQAVVEALRAVLAGTPATLVQDAPTMGTWIQRYLDFTRPDSFYAAGGGSMGWGFPAAMGMQLARPRERVLTVSGDGSFWMVAQDLETAVRENLPIVNIINNNFCYGNTRDRQRTAHGGRYHGVFYSNPDFAQFARLLGAHGERVETPGELIPALDRALASGKPAIVDVIQDRQEGLPPDLVPPTATSDGLGISRG